MSITPQNQLSMLPPKPQWITRMMVVILITIGLLGNRFLRLNLLSSGGGRSCLCVSGRAFPGLPSGQLIQPLRRNANFIYWEAL
jgi:hypothetical protein